MDGNWLFHMLNNLVFGRQYSTEEIRNEIYILIRKKHLYKNLWESDFDTHIRNIKRNGFWGTNLEKIAFSDMMRLNTIKYEYKIKL